MFCRNKKIGFTIIELLVTISILVILVSITISGFGAAREEGRDAQRQADLRTMEAALALYINKYGQYPAGCNSPTTGDLPIWSGQPDTDYSCPGNSPQYIVGLAPEFLPELPTDPRTNGGDSGYVYTTNSDRSVYKLMALNTVESELVEVGNPFFRCGQEFNPAIVNLDTSAGSSVNDSSICDRVPPSRNSGASPSGWDTLNSCDTQSEFETTYAVSAGFSSDARGNGPAPATGREYDTERVRCG